MLETGWSDRQLAATSPRRVEAMRWALFARAVEPIVSRDYDSAIKDVDRVDRPASKSTLKMERRQLVERYTQGKRFQAEVREILGLDDGE